jgi:hypothetical protein
LNDSGLLRRATRAMTARSSHRDTSKNDRNLDTSDLSINCLLSATWYYTFHRPARATPRTRAEIRAQREA